MKIVNRDTFIGLPSGVIFSKYKPCVFGELMIKGESIIFDNGNDFYYQDIADAIDCHDSGEFADKLFDSEANGTNLPMDFECQGRDGLFDKEQLFAVWSADDVADLMARLKHCIGA